MTTPKRDYEAEADAIMCLVVNADDAASPSTHWDKQKREIARLLRCEAALKAIIDSYDVANVEEYDENKWGMFDDGNEIDAAREALGGKV